MNDIKIHNGRTLGAGGFFEEFHPGGAQGVKTIVTPLLFFNFDSPLIFLTPNLKYPSILRTIHRK